MNAVDLVSQVDPQTFINIHNMNDKKPFDIPKEYEWLTTDTISEKKYGEQKWIGRVIGKNQLYIHFRDKTYRTWIFVGRKRIDHLQINDLIVAKVIRTKQQTFAKAVYVLKEV